MPKAIFANLAVSDLDRSKRFFEALGFGFDARFTNHEAASLVLSDTIYAMLHTPDSFRRFTPKTIADAHASTEVLLALQFESRERIEELMGKALAAGGREFRDPEDHGFMLVRSFEDPDGHVWELFWMDPAHVPN